MKNKIMLIPGIILGGLFSSGAFVFFVVSLFGGEQSPVAVLFLIAGALVLLYFGLRYVNKYLGNSFLITSLIGLAVIAPFVLGVR